MDERSSIIPGISATGSETSPPNEYSYSSQAPLSPVQILLNYALVAVVVFMAMITFILGIYRGFAVSQYGSTYFMLGFCHLALVLLESFVVLYKRSGELEGDKTKLFYVIGGLTLMHSVFTDVVLFSE